MTRVLFVCLGNICRSPAAEGVLRTLLEREGLSQDVVVASCGIGDWHLDAPPDPRMRKAAKERGIVLNTRAKVFSPEFLDEFDLILASDHEVLEYLEKFAKTPLQRAKIQLMTEFSQIYKGTSVPDPYYESIGAFDQVLDILEDSCQALLDQIKLSKQRGGNGRKNPPGL